MLRPKCLNDCQDVGFEVSVLHGQNFVCAGFFNRPTLPSYKLIGGQSLVVDLS